MTTTEFSEIVKETINGSVEDLIKSLEDKEIPNSYELSCLYTSHMVAAVFGILMKLDIIKIDD